MRLKPIFLLALVLTGCGASMPRPTTASTIDCAGKSGWNDPASPAKIHGDTWYVGTCGISAVLISSPKGHVLIDGGTEKGGRLIAANIAALGFKLEDVRYILNSHEHEDHAAGIAELQRASGATVLARQPAVATLQRGKSDRSDPQFLQLDSFPPIANVQVIADDETLRFGSLTLNVHATPGHTAGGTSWTWKSCENDQCIDIAYVDSLTAISDKTYRFSDEAAHPGVLDTFRKTIKSVAELPCDLLITPHPSASALWDRLGASATQPLLDKTACSRYATAATERLQRRLHEEQVNKAQ